ncbi:hypothetical protein ACJJTC_006041 [Scirpophaga incertulas]
MLVAAFCAMASVIVAAVAFPEKLNPEPSLPFKLYKRADWKATPATEVEPLSTPVQYVVIHHTYIPGACHTADQCKLSMQSMQHYHQSLEWGDIGYNFCVGSEGGAYEGRGWEVRGIHAGRANSISVGICLIGDWRTEVPPAKQLQTTKELIEYGVSKGFIRSDYKLMGHQQVMPTECPGGALFNTISKWDHFEPNAVLPALSS